MRTRLHSVFLVLLLVAATAPVLASPPALMNTQGVLRTQSGAPVADGVHALSFALYPSPTDPTPLWAESNGAVAVQGGFYSALLGGLTPIPASLFKDRAELWVGVKVDGGTELPRGRLLTVAYAFEASHALVAAAAESIQCSGCIGEGALGFDLAGKIQEGARAACYDTLAELRATLDAVYAPLAHTHDGGDITSPVAQCIQAADALGLEGRTLAQVKAEILASVDGAGYMKKGDKIDQSQLPPNGLDEVSNGLLTNQFQITSAATVTPVDIHDYYPPGVTTTVTFPDVGIAENVTITVSLTNSDISGITLQLTDPVGANYTLYDKGSTGGTLIATWPAPNPTVAGDLTSWTGKNPTGTWTLTTIDSHFDNKTWPSPDGQVLAFSITSRILSASRIMIDGDLDLNGHRLENVASPMTSTDGANRAYVDGKVGSVLVAIDGTTENGGSAPSARNTLSHEFIKFKEFRIKVPGTYTVSCEYGMSKDPAGGSAAVEVRINGSVVATSNSESGTWANFSHSVQVSQGDLISIYLKQLSSGGGDPAWIKNARLLFGGFLLNDVVLD